MLGDPVAFGAVLDAMEERVRGKGIHRIVAVESRGFIFGAPLADRLGIGFSPVRKQGKLPYRSDRVDYALEYGAATLEAHVDAVRPGEQVAIVDDLLATGGTAWAAAELVKRQQGSVGCLVFAVELAFLRGRERLSPAPVEALIVY